MQKICLPLRKQRQHQNGLETCPLRKADVRSLDFIHETI